MPVRVMIVIISLLLSLVSEVGRESSAGSGSFGCMGGGLCMSREMFEFLLGCVWELERRDVGEDIAIGVERLLSVDAGEGVHCEGSGKGRRVEDVSANSAGIDLY